MFIIIYLFITDKHRIRYKGEPTYNINHGKAEDNKRFQGLVDETILRKFNVVGGVKGTSLENGKALVSFKPVVIKTRLLAFEYCLWKAIFDQIEGKGKGKIEKVDDLRSLLIFKEYKEIDFKSIKKPSEQWKRVQHYIMRKEPLSDDSDSDSD